MFIANSFDCCHTVTQHIRKTDSHAELLLPQELPLCGDVKVELFHQARFGGKVCVCVRACVRVCMVYMCACACVCVCCNHVWNIV